MKNINQPFLKYNIAVEFLCNIKDIEIKNNKIFIHQSEIIGVKAMDFLLAK